jgi:hypothetical protein
MDARVKPGHDDQQTTQLNSAIFCASLKVRSGASGS